MHRIIAKIPYEQISYPLVNCKGYYYETITVMYVPMLCFVYLGVG